jgi:acetyl-CoA carboxylase biotin carboxyl carrier protein
MSELTEKDLFQLLEVFSDSDMTVLHVRSDGFEVLLSRNADTTGLQALAPHPDAAAVAPPVASPPQAAAPVSPERPAAAAATPPDSSDAAAAAPAAGAHEATVTAPSLGAFYHAPRPDLPPYVTVGARVEPDTTIGLIEAMKVFTAVSAGVHGVVQEILVANNEFVEYGQPLMRIAQDSGDVPGSA